MSFITYLRKISDTLFSTTAAGMYLLVFAFAIGAATFIENDYGTSSAQALVFRARWFEILMVLFACTLVANIIRFRLIQQKKWASVIFHSSIIIILLGSWVTRYYGFEGMMHIREGKAASTFLSSENYLFCQVITNNKSYSFSEELFLATLGNNHFDEEYQIGNHLLNIRLEKFLPNPTEKITEDPSGKAVIKVVIGGANGREEFFVSQGDRVNINGVNFNFTDTQLPNAFNVIIRNDSLLFATDVEVTETVMATQTLDTIPPSAYRELKLRALYVAGNSGFVIGDFSKAATVGFVAGEPRMKNESTAGLSLVVTHNGDAQTVFLTGKKGLEGQPEIVDFGDVKISLQYGAIPIKVPFQIQLRDFILERYPGTNNPSSYASEVNLMDERKGINKPYRIFMNNILDYGGYRFFQSSYDQDEMGTYLSVNHDFWGTWISYIGYILLTIGMAMTFFSKNSRFTQLTKKMRSFQQKNTSMALLFMFVAGISTTGNTQTVLSDVNNEEADAFGKMVVQDFKGRFKPVNTLSGELLRKMAKKGSLYGLTADQIFLSMTIFPEKWENVPIIDIGKHPEIKKLINASGQLVSYRQFFDEDSRYILRDQIRNAQNMNPKDQGTFEKTIIKLDEKINIANMIFSGSFLKFFPVPNDENYTWVSPREVKEMPLPDPKLLDGMDKLSSYLTNIQKNGVNGDVASNRVFLDGISMYQQQYSGNIVPSATRIKAELLLNQLDVFGRLRNFYGLVSLIFLVLFFGGIFYTKLDLPKVTIMAFWVLSALFVFHTIGLSLRWYVSGRAPWSNGYESMIYIGWTTVLAGIIFSRKSLGGMVATTILAATILLVAGMSWLDPEITPLVPVLKSYWLTIHVSLEAGSYGFLMLGAVIGMLNLLLIIFTNNNNKEKMNGLLRELTTISEITLLGGLFMVSVGTYLGGVWANESWGRYWGWDAKETWALVTILVYAFILHMRFIPGLQSLYAFNFASLFGFATVIMTYFGVNYYLSGLHSYAAGDPVPVPSQVYYTAVILGVLSILAYINWRKIFRKE
ncbi:MAG: cytochrome c biogenesis protein CcsA [Saprospiraceae bacterium]|nr:cytochrome c biogenesis protein CcsA [Saprospiraceae bacterium]